MYLAISPIQDMKKVIGFLLSWLSILVHNMCAMFELHTSEYVRFMYLIGSDTKRVSVSRYYTEKFVYVGKNILSSILIITTARKCQV